jgi:hypothetical protein
MHVAFLPDSKNIVRYIIMKYILRLPFYWLQFNLNYLGLSTVSFLSKR